MLGLLWQLIKLIKHALPFLNEVANPNDAKDEKDRIIIDNLRSLIRTALWRILMVAIFFFTTLYVVIPLHTENAVLKQENNGLEERIEYLRKRLESAQTAREEVNKQMNQMEIRLINKDSELKVIRDKLEHCYQVGCGAEYKSTKVLDPTSLPKSSSVKETGSRVSVKSGGNPKTPSQKSAIPKHVIDRLDTLN